MAYTTYTDVKTYIGGIQGTGDDALLTVLIAAAQKFIDTFCRRTFEASSDTTRYIDAVGDHIRGRTLYLDDVGELAAITTVTNGDGIVVSSSEYTTIPRNSTPYNALILLSSAGKSWTYTDDWEGAISILGKWAYSTSAPADIVQACKDIVKHMYRSRADDGQDRTIISEGMVITPSQIPASALETLRAYRRY